MRGLGMQEEGSMASQTARVRPLALVLAALCATAGAAESAKAGKIPVTTASEDARKLYLQGRELSEKLRFTDSRGYFEQALQEDSDFALAYLGLANSAGTAKQFFDNSARGAALAERVSPGEREMLLATEAIARGDLAGQERHLSQLVKDFPNDERAQTLMGTYCFARQDYARAIEHYTKATTIEPSFSPPYNMLGYANRFLGKYQEAEVAFKEYIELIPDDPNPYDSYAELLMKMGRFDDSIRNYDKALSLDPHFTASLVGIANDQIFQGRTDAARATLAKLDGLARNNGERRLARQWMANAYVHDGAPDKALAEVATMVALAKADKDYAAQAGDLNLMGDILRDAFRLDEGAAKYAAAVAAMDTADVPGEVKEATRRNLIFEQGRLAVARKDLAGAKAKSAEYAKQVAAKANQFEEFQVHQLAGLIGLAANDVRTAVAELQQANPQDPQVLYQLALAAQAAGDAAGAKALATRAANFNALNFNYAYVRAKARQLAGS
jgi:tetratricopeptide (TPR) repeat protein